MLCTSSTFGFTELTLADWARARGARADVIDVGLEDLSRNNIDAIASKLRRATGGQAVVVNATNYEQLKCLDAAARQAEAAGSTFVYRTGPSFVRAAAGLGQPVIAELVRGGRARRHGLVVVGSHSTRTPLEISRTVADALTETVRQIAASTGVE